jgi:hypothetical protein
MRKKIFIALLPPLVVFALASGADAADRNFTAHLHGRDEVPANESHGQGQVILKLNAAETELSYKLISSNIENVIVAHIHLGPVGVNGPVVVFLTGTFAPGEGRTNGVLATGTITAANLTGPLAGMPLSVLVDHIRDGNTYVNVHTLDLVPPAGTGPGDLPAGEIRGQIG